MKTNNAIKSRTSTCLSIVVRQMPAILMTSVFILCIILVSLEAVHADTTQSSITANSVKWHPGHYYTILSWGKDNPKYLAQVYNELAETPALRGIQIRYLWSELEPAEGVYDFTSIEQRLSELTVRKKRLVILLQMRSFNTKTVLVPDYLKERTYEGGVFAFKGAKGNNGANIKFWHSLVHDRLVALISALGERFNSHPNFEGIGITETAFGKSLEPISSDQEYGFYSNLLSINKQMRKHFPNTMTYQFTNYPRSILASFVNDLGEMGTALGGPDTYPDDPGLVKGVYTYYPKLSGIVPLTPSVMPMNYVNTRSDRKGEAPTVSELLNFARDKLKANYIFWTRAPAYYREVLKVLNEPNQTSDPAGGLDSTCPKVYPSCVN